MIRTVAVWVFVVIGEPLTGDHGTPYVQIEASAYMHDVRPDVVEHDCMRAFHKSFPGRCVCDCGWALQTVEVNRP